MPRESLVKIVNDEEEFAQLIKNSQLTIVEFFTWCPPCIKMLPIYERFSKIYTDIQFIQLDVDKFEDLSINADINYMPSYVIYVSGKMTSQRVTGTDSTALRNLIESISNIKRNEMTI